MTSGPYRDLQLLDMIGEGKPLAQRALSKRLNVAPGVTNVCLKRRATSRSSTVQPRRPR